MGSEWIVADCDELKELCARKFMAAGIPEDHARIAADVLVHANLRGVDSHGVLRMEHYINKIAFGGIEKNPDIRIEQTGPVTAIVDGGDGLGHVVVDRALEHAVELAREQGVGMVGAVNSSHCGALSYFVRKAALQGFVGLAMTNTDKMVVPFGGKSAFFGTNPLAYGFPAASHPPVILDMATSAAAYGKILEAQSAGKTIPADWAVDRDGRPITRPEDFAALLPFGGAKGYGLGMVVDIFAGILMGASFGPHVNPMHGGDYRQKRKLGHFVCAIDPGKFTSAERFAEQMDRMIEELGQASPADGFDRVMVPGEPEHLTEIRRRKHGIPVPGGIYRFLTSV